MRDSSIHVVAFALRKILHWFNVQRPSNRRTSHNRPPSHTQTHWNNILISAPIRREHRTKVKMNIYFVKKHKTDQIKCVNSTNSVSKEIQVQLKWNQMVFGVKWLRHSNVFRVYVCVCGSACQRFRQFHYRAFGCFFRVHHTVTPRTPPWTHCFPTPHKCAFY